MAGFDVAGQHYDLIGLDDLEDMDLGEVEVLEEVAGITLDELTGERGVVVSSKLVLGLVLISMRRVNAEATVAEARKVKLSVLGELAKEIANTEDDADPPPRTELEGSGPQL